MRPCAGRCMYAFAHGHAVFEYQLFKVAAGAPCVLTMPAAQSRGVAVLLLLAVLLLARHTALCQHHASAELDNEIQTLRAELDGLQADLRYAEERAAAAREQVRATLQQLEHLTSIRMSQRHQLRLEPYIIAPNSEMPMYADFIYIGLCAVFCAPAGAAHVDPPLQTSTSSAGCEEVRLHVLERSPKHPSSSNFSAGERVHMAVGSRSFTITS